MSRPLAVLALITAVGAVLIFTNLDDRYLWEDEAETALLAQRVLRFGVPIAWDGRDLISQRCGTDYDANYLWRETPWMQFYVTALSFKLLGAGTLTARLPFAALGVMAIVSLYVLGVSLFGDRALALLATAILVLSVPFLLYVRQVRYYAIAVLAGIWVLYFFFALVRDRRGALLGLALAMTVLFHTNYLVFFATTAGLGLAFVAVWFETRSALRLAGAGVATLAINLAWLAIFDVRGKVSYAVTGLSVQSFAERAWQYLSWTELYACSVVLLGVLVVTCSLLTFGRLGLPSWPAPRTCVSLALLAIGHVLVLAAVPHLFFRYVVSLLPAFALLEAAAIRALWSANRLAAVAGCALLLFVDRADLAQGSLGSTLAKYAYEITHHVPGPIAGIVRHLRAHAEPGQRIFISYGDLPLRFYTDLEVRGGLGCQGLAGWPRPDWIVDRSWKSPTDTPEAAPGSGEDAERTHRYLQEIAFTRRYARNPLPQVDTVWENIPEPVKHLYRAPVEGQRITIYRKVAP